MKSNKALHSDAVNRARERNRSTGKKNTNSIVIHEREMTSDELARMNSGFEEHAIEHGNPKEKSERFGFVAVDGETFIGCSIGLAYKKNVGYANWFYITDLFVEKACRDQGLGSDLLHRLE